MQIALIETDKPGIRTLQLTNGATTIVDDDLPDRLRWVYTVKWRAHRSRNNVYARGSFMGMDVRLHRVLMECPKHLIVDHINGNSLDNRLENLRRCGPSKNMKNRCPSWIERRQETMQQRLEHGY